MDTNVSFILTKDPCVKTLEDELKYFNLDLKSLDTSLEELRKHKESKKAHDSCLKFFDKKLQKLSLKFHPDKLKNRGASDQELVIALNLYITLNKIRKIFTVLNEACLEDINVDVKYSYFTKLNISSLEDDIKIHVYEVIFIISSISEIKNREVITEIKQFLILSENCLTYFLENNVVKFRMCWFLVVNHLRMCVVGYENLFAEMTRIEKKCEGENTNFIYDLIEKLRSELSHNIPVLKAIKNNDEFGTCEFFSTSEYLDEYYVLPVVIYVNLINMCSVMLEHKDEGSWWNPTHEAQQPIHNDGITVLLDLHYLVQFYKGYEQYKTRVEKMIGKREPLTDEVVREYFRDSLRCIKNHLEDKFRVSDYHIEIVQKFDVAEEYKKCKKMVAVLRRNEEELKNNIKKLSRRIEYLEEKYERDMKEIEEFYCDDEQRKEQTEVAHRKISPVARRSLIQTL